MKYVLEKSAVLSFVALKIIVFSALIFVITGCQSSDGEGLISSLTPTVVETNIPSPTEIVATATPSQL